MRRPLCYICMAFVAAVFIMLRIQPMQEHTLAADRADCVVTLQGLVTAKEYKNGSLILYLQGEDKEGFLCYMASDSEPRLGSVVSVSGKASAFRESRNAGGFNQKEYYALQRVYFQLRDARLLGESAHYDEGRELLYRLRRQMEHILEQYMTKEDAAVMKAMLLGNKTELDADMKQLYQKSGIAHILAISGLHISLLGMGLYHVLRSMRTPAWASACFSVAVMLLYGEMVGMSSSAYRAIFMFAMKMGAEVLHRTYDMLTALALAAVGVLIEQPLYLYQAGFLLSFGAILGIGCMLDVIKTDATQVSLPFLNGQKNNFIKNKLCKLIEGLESGLAVFCVHFPIMLRFYYEFPVYSFLLNLVVIPAMGLVMLSGLICIGFGWLPLGIFQGIAALSSLGCHWLLALFAFLCEGSLSLPAATWITGCPDGWRIATFYLMMAALYVLYQYQKRRRCCLPHWYRLLCLLAAVVMITGRSYGRLQITVLDVGQGDGIWLESARGGHYLIDAGSTSQSGLGRYTLVPFLKYTGSATLDAIFLTHLDEDHISGVRELLEDSQGVHIRQVVLARAIARDEAYEQLLSLCAQADVPVRFVEAGDSLRSGALSMEIIHPDRDYQAADRNDCSLVMKLEYGQFHALFTGDVGAESEQRVLEALPAGWKCQLYKAAHHGSRFSNCEALLTRIEPQLAVISCGEGNSYGHPHKETLSRLYACGARVLQTKECGAIHFSTDGDTVQISRFLKE